MMEKSELEKIIREKAERNVYDRILRIVEFAESEVKKQWGVTSWNQEPLCYLNDFKKKLYEQKEAAIQFEESRLADEILNKLDSVSYLFEEKQSK